VPISRFQDLKWDRETDATNVS